MKDGIKGFLKTLAVAVILVALAAGGSLYLKSLSPRQTVYEEGTKIYVEGLSFYGNGSDSIFGTVYKPADTSGRKPVVVWCHGLGDDSKSADQMCRMFAGKGYIAYAFDFKGGSPQSKSSGDPLKMSVLTEKADLESVIERIRKASFAKKNKIYLAGHSLGGLVASLASDEKGVKGLVLLAPAYNVPDLCEVQYPKNRQVQDSTDFGGIMTVGKDFITDAKSVKPYKGLSKFKGDVLIIHGAEDTLVPVEYSIRAASEFKNADLQILDGVGHAFNGENAERTRAIIGNYLESQKN